MSEACSPGEQYVAVWCNGTEKNFSSYILHQVSKEWIAADVFSEAQQQCGDDIAELESDFTKAFNEFYDDYDPFNGTLVVRQNNDLVLESIEREDTASPCKFLDYEVSGMWLIGSYATRAYCVSGFSVCGRNWTVAPLNLLAYNLQNRDLRTIGATAFSLLLLLAATIFNMLNWRRIAGQLSCGGVIVITTLIMILFLCYFINSFPATFQWLLILLVTGYCVSTFYYWLWSRGENYT